MLTFMQGTSRGFLPTGIFFCASSRGAEKYRSVFLYALTFPFVNARIPPAKQASLSTSKRGVYCQNSLLIADFTGGSDQTTKPLGIYPELIPHSL